MYGVVRYVLLVLCALEVAQEAWGIELDVSIYRGWDPLGSSTVPLTGAICTATRGSATLDSKNATSGVALLDLGACPTLTSCSVTLRVERDGYTPHLRVIDIASTTPEFSSVDASVYLSPTLPDLSVTRVVLSWNHVNILGGQNLDAALLSNMGLVSTFNNPSATSGSSSVELDRDSLSSGHESIQATSVPHGWYHYYVHHSGTSSFDAIAAQVSIYSKVSTSGPVSSWAAAATMKRYWHVFSFRVDECVSSLNSSVTCSNTYYIPVNTYRDSAMSLDEEFSGGGAVFLHGHCSDGGIPTSCSVTQGQVGTKDSDNSTTIVIVVVSVAAVAFIVAMCLCFVLLRRKRRNKGPKGIHTVRSIKTKRSDASSATADGKPQYPSAVISPTGVVVASPRSDDKHDSGGRAVSDGKSGAPPRSSPVSRPRPSPRSSPGGSPASTPRKSPDLEIPSDRAPPSSLPTKFAVLPNIANEGSGAPSTAKDALYVSVPGAAWGGFIRRTDSGASALFDKGGLQRSNSAARMTGVSSGLPPEELSEDTGVRSLVRSGSVKALSVRGATTPQPTPGSLSRGFSGSRTPSSMNRSGSLTPYRSGVRF